MSSKNELSTRFLQSLPDEIRGAVQEYGYEYYQFLDRHPTLQNRKLKITSAYDAVSRNDMTLSEIDSHFHPGASEFWIQMMLIDLFMVVGAFDATTTYQFKAIAARIRDEYYHLTSSELTRFFYEFSIGEYDEMYVGKTVNPQCIFKSLKKYMYRLYEKRAEVHEQELQEKLKKKKLEASKNAISWDEYYRRTKRNGSENPLSWLKAKAEKESKRDKNGGRR